MTEKAPINQEREDKSRVRTEQEYVDMCVQYALSIGWVKEAQKDFLIEKYLKPIHRKYLEIIEELRKEKVPEDDLAKTVLRMNNCLESTRRIGSTDPENIIRSIEDARKSVMGRREKEKAYRSRPDDCKKRRNFLENFSLPQSETCE
ncbi:MAG: hypothetical protein UX72_C0011G0045 [Parcubacteria group bacterium GW2011_GWA2_47_10]|nr:MAG: hypothetical protein UX72_C0011G0045 [Parcubacteria group bacterium GW2011_GWA2_47_10]